MFATIPRCHIWDNNAQAKSRNLEPIGVNKFTINIRNRIIESASDIKHEI